MVYDIYAEKLREALLAAAQDGDAILGEQDGYGQRYGLVFVMAGPVGEATVHSSWIVRRGEDFPRLTSCYVI